MPLSISGIRIEDTFAEAFDMRATALIVTADTMEWARRAADSLCGFATSIIACGVEAGIDRQFAAEETPDGRPGVRVLLFAGSTRELQRQLQNRVGQCVLTSPGSACFAGLDGTERLKLGDALRWFGDGWQISKRLGEHHYWRVPVMDGEFVCEATTGLTKTAVGGGNLILIGPDRASVRRGAELAVQAMRDAPGVVMPFPGGVARSGSKIGSKYKKLVASTNRAFCPTLRGLAATMLEPGDGAVLEIVIDGLTDHAVADAMRMGIAALTARGRDSGVKRITAGNYGGKLGRHHYRLAELVP